MMLAPAYLDDPARRAWLRANGLTPPDAVPRVKPAPVKPDPLTLKRARQARYYVRRKARGTCKSCPNPLDNDLSRCEACREKRRGEKRSRRAA